MYCTWCHLQKFPVLPYEHVVVDHLQNPPQLQAPPPSLPSASGPCAEPERLRQWEYWHIFVKSLGSLEITNRLITEKRSCKELLHLKLLLRTVCAYKHMQQTYWELCGNTWCSPILTDAALDCGPLLVGSGVAGESVGSRQVARCLRVFVGALAALVALLSVPRVTWDLDTGLLLVHLSIKRLCIRLSEQHRVNVASERL